MYFEKQLKACCEMDAKISPNQSDESYLVMRHYDDQFKKFMTTSQPVAIRVDPSVTLDEDNTYISKDLGEPTEAVCRDRDIIMKIFKKYLRGEHRTVTIEEMTMLRQYCHFWWAKMHDTSCKKIVYDPENVTFEELNEFLVHHCLDAF